MTHTPEMVELVARAICREKCAFYGEPPCFEVSDDWPNPHCDEPGCMSLGVAALDALRLMIEAQVRDECAKVAESCPDAHWGPWVAAAIRGGSDMARALDAIREGRG